MNTFKNPLIVTWEYEEPGFTDTNGHWEYKLKNVDPRFETGEFISKEIAQEMYETLQAIVARIQGEWDNPHLQAKIGTLTDLKTDCLLLASVSIFKASE